MTTTHPDESYVPLSILAAELGLQEYHLRRWSNFGLPSQRAKVGGKLTSVAVLRSDLRAWLREHPSWRSHRQIRKATKARLARFADGGE